MPCWHADHRRTRLHVLRHHRSCTGAGVVAQPDRSAQDGVTAQEDALSDLGAVLVHAIEIGGDRAGAHIGLRTNPGVAKVAEVSYLHTAGQVTVLDLREVPDVDTAGYACATAQVRVRPDIAAIA